MVGKNGAIYVSFFLSQSLCGESEVAVEKYIIFLLKTLFLQIFTVAVPLQPLLFASQL